MSTLAQSIKCAALPPSSRTTACYKPDVLVCSTMHQWNQQLWHYLSRQRHLSFMKTFCCSCSRTAFVTKSDTNTGCYNKKSCACCKPFQPQPPHTCCPASQKTWLLLLLLRPRKPAAAAAVCAAAYPHTPAYCALTSCCCICIGLVHPAPQLLVLRARPQLLQLHVMRPPQLLLHLLYLLLTPPQLLMLRVRPRTALSPAAAASALIAVYAASSAGAAASALAAAFFLLFLLIFRLVASSCSNSGSST